MRMLGLSLTYVSVHGLALAAGMAAACAPFAGQEPDGGDPIGDPVGATCTGGTMPLVVTKQSTPLGTQPSKLFVPATYRHEGVLFELDTGSPRTFIHELLQDGGTTSNGDVTPDAGSVELGCDTLTLYGLGVSASPAVDGKTVAGTFGGDHILAKPMKLDLVANQVTWNEPGTPFAEAASWPSAPFDRPLAYARISDVSLDGTAVKLIVDTGSPDSLWLGQQGQPGDTEVDGVDANGDTIQMFLGTAELTMGSYKTKIPVFRVPKFQYLQNLVDQLGDSEKIDGLFGLSSYAKGIVIDTDAKLVRVAP
jgi:hypothetical protein